MKQVRVGPSGFFHLHSSPGRRALRRQWSLGVPVFWVIAAISGGDLAGTLALAVVGPLAWALLLYDLRYLILPDGLVLTLAVSGLALNAGCGDQPGFVGLTSAALGALIAGLSLETVRRAYRWLRGVDGLGMGDVKLFAAIGCWVGVSQLAAVLLMACLATLGGALLARLRPGRAGWRHRMPFGPGLLVALSCAVWLSRPGLWPLVAG